jgi:ligand-binding sensor domain-containing protein
MYEIYNWLQIFFLIYLFIQKAILGIARKLCRVLALVLLFPSLSGLGQTHIFKHYTQESGLPSNEVYYTIQDKKGYLWFATDRGVCRFDGYSFKSFSTSHGLTDNTIFRAYEDREGKIWFIGLNGRMCYYSGDTILPYVYNHLLDSLEKSKIPSGFFFDENQTLYIGFIRGGIISITKTGKISFQNNNREDPSDCLFAVTSAGVVFGTTVSNSLSRPKRVTGYFREGGETKKILFENEYRAIEERYCWLKRKSGVINIYTGGTLLRIKDGIVRDTFLKSNPLISISEDKDSCLWISWRKGGISKFKPNEGIFKGQSKLFLHDQLITHSFFDNTGGVWFSTLNNGIFYLPALNFEYYCDNPGTMGQNAISFTKGRKNEVFIAFANGAIHRYIDGAFIEKVIPKLGTDSTAMIWNMAYDSTRHILWVTSEKNENITFTKPDKLPVRFINKFSNTLHIKGGNLLMGTNHSINVFDLSDMESREKMIYTKMRLNKWDFKNHENPVGFSSNGIYELVNGKLTKQFKEIEYLNYRITGYLVLKDTTKLFGTLGKGLVIVQKDGTISHLNKSNGFPSDLINEIEKDDDTIWVSTEAGLLRLKHHGGKTFDTEPISFKQGFPARDARKILITKTDIWTLTRSGVFKIPKNFSAGKLSDFPLYLNSIFVDGIESALINNRIEGRDYRSHVSVSFVGLCFPQLGNINYRYRLNGPNNPWTYTRSTKIDFQNLVPGEYLLEIQAEGNDGVWNPNVLALGIFIPPPFWKSLWFILFLIIFLSAIILLIFQLKISALRKKNRLVTELNQYREKSLSLQMNPHFVFNSLNSIQAYILSNEKNLAVKYLNRFSKLIRLIFEDSGKTAVPLARELEAIKLYVELELLRQTRPFEFNLNIDPEINPPLIIQPLLENAIRHGISKRKEGNGIIIIEFNDHNRFLEISIKDNGIGIHNSEKPGSEKRPERQSALKITAQRIKILSSQAGIPFFFNISLQNQNNPDFPGTTITFNLPKFNNEYSFNNN